MSSVRGHTHHITRGSMSHRKNHSYSVYDVGDFQLDPQNRIIESGGRNADASASASAPLLAPPVTAGTGLLRTKPVHGIARQLARWLARSPRSLALATAAVCACLFLLVAWTPAATDDFVVPPVLGPSKAPKNKLESFADWIAQHGSLHAGHSAQSPQNYWSMHEDELAHQYFTELSRPSGGDIPVSALPLPRAANRDDSSAKYIGFLPHSGFHNQRIALQNALLLGHLTNRTVLVPPIWIGWPTPTLEYDELQEAWTQQVEINTAAFQLDNATLAPGSDFWLPEAEFRSSAQDYPDREGEELYAKHIKELAHHRYVARTRWAEMGYVVRPDGFPITNLTAADCKSYTPECRHTYKDTFLSWDFLVNFDAIAHLVSIVDRWDMREKAIEDLLGVEPDDVYVLKDYVPRDFQFANRILYEDDGVSEENAGESEGADDRMGDSLGEGLSEVEEDVADRLAREDAEREQAAREQYEKELEMEAEVSAPRSALIVKSINEKTPWNRIVSIPLLSARPERVILMGSLFGYGRISGTKDEIYDDIKMGLVFHNPFLLEPADAVSKRLHAISPTGYVGVHARVGDGKFKENAVDNMRGVWDNMLNQLAVSATVRTKLWSQIQEEIATESPDHRSESGAQAPAETPASSTQEDTAQETAPARRGRHKRQDAEHAQDADTDAGEGREPLQDSDVLLSEETAFKSPGDIARDAALKRAEIEAMRSQTDKYDIPLKCRGDLHTDPFLRKLNMPLYLATDSLAPLEDNALKPFFKAFPCTFILSDFDTPSETNYEKSVEGISVMKKLVNKHDGLSLGRLFIPFLEAIIASKGNIVVGTPGSTFSEFTETTLHKAYYKPSF